MSIEFRIAVTFTDSLARLSGDEQKAAKTTAFDLQTNPTHPGLGLHRLDHSRDRHFWSARVSDDIRIIVHRTDAGMLLCYVDHHDKAYQWAERRKLETHPRTGAAQLVEIRERVQEIIIPKYVDAEPGAAARLPLLRGITAPNLLEYGVPQEWIGDILAAADEDTLLAVAEHLPAEAAEALLELAVGGQPVVSPAVPEHADPFEHPDAQRRFRVMADVEELERALAAPWDKWTVFLHPEQRDWVQRSFSGPARVSGSAGTGKTVVALHRAVHLARSHPEARVLLATFSDALAHALAGKVRRLTGSEPRLGERIDVCAMNAIGERLYATLSGPPRLADPAQIRTWLATAIADAGGVKFSARFVSGEWEDVVDAWQLESWEAYRDVPRLGRKTRLGETQRASLWPVFERVRARLHAEGLLTWAGLFTRLAAALPSRAHPPFEFAVIDESQDVSVAQMRFLAALGAGRPDALFFAGDLGQRIFQQPYSWKSLGIDIRGRARTLRVNYRTSHQIRTLADRLLGPESADVDGNVEAREHTISTFNGPVPTIRVCDGEAQECAVVAGWLGERIAEGAGGSEIAVIVRSDAEIARAEAALNAAGLLFVVLDEHLRLRAGHVAVCTMHLAKGLEFRSVAVMACDDEILPLQSRMAAVTDPADLEEIYSTERHLLYVAATRARDDLLVTALAPASEFLDDLAEARGGRWRGA